MRTGGVKGPENFVDVLYVWSLGEAPEGAGVLHVGERAGKVEVGHGHVLRVPVHVQHLTKRVHALILVTIEIDGFCILKSLCSYSQILQGKVLTSL